MYWKVVVALVAATAGAATAEEKRPDPKDPKAKAPLVEHRSAFEGYRAYAEPELAPWRGVNEEVGRVGGHLGIVRKPKPAAHGEHK